MKRISRVDKFQEINLAMHGPLVKVHFVFAPRTISRLSRKRTLCV